MDLKLSGSVGNPEIVRENFNKIKAAFDTIGGGGGSLPDQTGHAGEYLSTDGSTASWKPVDRNIDGGYAGAIYLSTQKIDGGNAHG
jgi:hypothetical protein